jgi:hypothetical protein
MNDKPIIIAYGNCGAQAFSYVLSSIPEIQDQYEIIWYFYDTHPVFKQPLVSDEQYARTAFMLEQVFLWSPPPEFKSKLSPTCVTITFPTFFFNTIWPLQAPEPRNILEPPEFPVGRYFIGDRLIINLLKQGLSSDEVYAHYMAARVSDSVDLDRLLEINSDQVMKIDELADIKTAARILDDFRTTRLFWTPTHPTNALLRPIFQELLARMGFAQHHAAIDTYFAAHGELLPQPRFELPIHPQVIEHLKLQWGDPDYRYLYYHDQRFTFSEYMRNYIDFK